MLWSSGAEKLVMINVVEEEGKGGSGMFVVLGRYEGGDAGTGM
jgi:hypothetical protein